MIGFAAWVVPCTCFELVHSGGGLMSDYRVGSLLVISLQNSKKISIKVRSCVLQSRSCSVASTILAILRCQITLTGLLHAYPSASHSSSASHIQNHAI